MTAGPQTSTLTPFLYLFGSPFADTSAAAALPGRFWCPCSFLKCVFVSSQKLKDVESIVKIVELDGDDLVKDYSDDIERMLGSKMKSVKVKEAFQSKCGEQEGVNIFNS